MFRKQKEIERKKVEDEEKKRLMAEKEAEAQRLKQQKQYKLD